MKSEDTFNLEFCVYNATPFADYDILTSGYLYKHHLELLMIDTDGFTYKLDVKRRDDTNALDEYSPAPFIHFKSYLIRTGTEMSKDDFIGMCNDLKNRGYK